MLNYLPSEYIKTKTLKINHNYLLQQFSDYKKILKEIEKVVKACVFTLGKKLNINFKDIKPHDVPDKKFRGPF